jgi:putative ABC transport system permease protein
VPITALASVLITALACLVPVRSAVDVDPAIVLRGE